MSWFGAGRFAVFGEKVHKYAHDYPNHYVRQQYLPDAFKDQKFYHMGDLGYEKEMKEHMRRIRGDESDEE